MDFELLLQRIFDGIATGAVYAVVAVAMVLIFKATTLINFAQGELAMIGAFVCFVFSVEYFQMSPWIAAPIAMILTAILGMGIERVLLRRFDPEDHLPVVLITLGVFFIINGLAGVKWNYEAQAEVPRLVPAKIERFKENPVDIGFLAIKSNRIEIAGARISYDSIGMVLALIIMLSVIFLILNRTKMGLAFRAVSSNTESSRLVGIRVGRVLSFGWALACAFGTLGAILVAPLITLQPNMMGPVLVFALAAAAFGGLDSVGGAAIGGLAVGLINSVGLGFLTDEEIFSGFRATPLVPPLLILLAMLWFRPSGLFGTKRIERV